MPRFAANLSLMFTEHALLDRFAAAADAGFRHVEMQFPYEVAPATLAAAARRAGVEVVLFNLPPGEFARGERGLACVEGAERRFRMAVTRGLAYAEALGVRLVHVMGGIGRADDRPTWLRLERNLAEAADALERHGVTTVVEPINPVDMPGYVLNSFDLAERLVRTLDRPHVRLLYDIYHRQMLHGGIAASLERLMPLVGHVQVAGVPGRHEPDGCEIDYRYIFGRLDALGYAGVVGCEYRPRGRTEDGLGWMRGAEG